MYALSDRVVSSAEFVPLTVVCRLWATSDWDGYSDRAVSAMRVAAGPQK